MGRGALPKVRWKNDRIRKKKDRDRRKAAAGSGGGAGTPAVDTQAEATA